MSLVDQSNPARWADGSERSQGNAFTQTFSGQAIDWKPMQRRANLRTTSAKAVERQRAAGQQVGSIPLMGRKQKAVFSIENAAAGRKSTDRRAAIRRGGI